ncbi:efflux RND transporter periplasmic adaptor subunit [Nonomuraea sp. 3-1Str]|uniref:efflux RND transporter periplasmic adaptor subunit n=1 Tax=Nonomuraea sp. 3-1Str TaxID=2929801 RepID=UPI00286430E5|nr:efflux RND transporter periplasmic adaptor subunit [Nonomuraea sp. 3-1Str]MDR8413364.1 efflux RND transporter periplasmic adaptor subunit [Nonomuraea sp. 3-1Str]
MRPTSRPKALALGALALAVLAGGSGLAVALRDDAPATARIQLAAARRGAVTASVTAAGNTVDGSRRDLAFGGSGTVTRVYVKVGAKVRKGQVLARIDGRAARESYEAAKADLAAAEEALEDASSSTTATSSCAPSSSAAPAAAAQGLAAQAAVFRQAGTPAPLHGTAASPTPTPSSASHPPGRPSPDPTRPEPRPTATVTVTATVTATVTVTATATATATATTTVTAAPPTRPSTTEPTAGPTGGPAPTPTVPPAGSPTGRPTGGPSAGPTGKASPGTSGRPTGKATGKPTGKPSGGPSGRPSGGPSTRASSGARPSQGACAPGGGAKGGLGEEQAQANVDRAQAALEQAADAVRGTRIVAPAAGTVLSVAGRAGDAAGGGTFVSLGDLDEQQVQAMVTESDVNRLKIGQKAQITLATRPGQRYAGRVTGIAPTATTDGSLVRYSVALAFDEPPSGIMLGQTASVVVTTGSAADAVYVPVAAVRGRADGASVVTVRSGGRDATRVVRTGVRGDQYVQVTSGLSESDQVVLEGGSGSGFPDGAWPGR